MSELQQSHASDGNALPKQERNNVIRGAIIVGILFALALVVDAIWFRDSPLRGKGAEPTYARRPELRYVSQAGSLERAVEEIALTTFGKTVNWEGRPYTIIAVDNIPWHEGGRLIVVKYRANENLTPRLTKIGIISDALELNEAVFTNPKCQEVSRLTLMAHMQLEDRYGNRSTELVANLIVDRNLAAKINWENMYPDKFEQLVRMEGDLRFHPALQT